MSWRGGSRVHSVGRAPGTATQQERAECLRGRFRKATVAPAMGQSTLDAGVYTECRLACWRAGWGFIRTDDVRMLYYQRLEPGKFWTQEKCLRGPFRKPTVAPAMGWCTYTFAKSATVSRTHVRINAVPSSPMSLPLRSSLASDEHCASTPASLPAPSSQ